MGNYTIPLPVGAPFGVDQQAEQVEREMQLPGNRIFYLSIPPSSFASVCEGLAQAGLTLREELVCTDLHGADLAEAAAVSLLVQDRIDAHEAAGTSTGKDEAGA